MNIKIRKEDIPLPIEELIRQLFLKEWQQELEDQTQHMKAIVAVANELSQFRVHEKESYQAEVNQKIHSLLDKVWEIPEEVRFEEKFESLHSGIKEYIDDQPDEVIELQAAERFSKVEGDSVVIKMAKGTKSGIWSLTTLPIRVANLFRKNKKAPAYWAHIVPAQALLLKHYQSKLASDLISLSDGFYHALIQQYELTKDWQEKALSFSHEHEWSYEEVVSAIDTFHTRTDQLLKKELTRILGEKSKMFCDQWDKIDTLELSDNAVSTQKLEKLKVQSQQEWEQRDLKWRNALYALFEDWRSDLDLYALKHSVLSELGKFNQAQTEKVNQQLFPVIHDIRAFIDEEGTINSKDNLQKELKRIHYQTTKQLDKVLVPQFVDKLSSQIIVNLLNKLELEVVQHVQGLSEEHIIVKNGQYDQPMDKEDFYSISIHELVTFEILVNFQKQIAQQKSQVFSTLSQMTVQAQDIDHIITFSLTSALSSIEEGTEEEEAIKIAIEGIERAKGRVQEIEEGINRLLTENIEMIKSAMDDFVRGIMDLLANENIKELRLRITKAKAAQQAKQVRKQVKDQLLERGQSTWQYLKKNYDLSKSRIQRLSGQFILTAGKPELTKQVSDFLHESQQAIDKLPTIYQRLYEIEPLEDMELFEGREKELESLGKAYENWKMGRYAATVVLGEKWGGLTSFVNYAEKKLKFSHKITRHRFVGNQFSTIDLLAEFSSLLGSSFQSLEELQKHLLEGPKRIMILEDVQNAYLRKVGGFEALEALGSLIAATGHHIFWLSTSTIYSWDYLSKSIQFHEYFSYQIKLSDLKKEQIVNLIWKRNCISGFKITFEEDESLANDKKFQRLSPEEKQLKLSEDYFQELNSFAKSNVSMALLFWLLSTRDMDANEITIGKFEKPNLNFLKSLSNEKVYVLHALIMHDGLKINQLCLVMKQTKQQIAMILSALREDGIVLLTEEIFMINPVIYRGVINLLISKNLIH
ncbi:MarR family transcriptional regulator [Reichenbachiella ulvae]|uniref:ATP-binding protein n=1 Tax=Reichenbachiella ulvae TaxID=2980104 RepID=A0ABT3CQJ2_9BACT|nr:helix-turn-helix domain-containing protein [Reichenbachiella ulvae]MCV9385919.1 hypothetical protein [Reichenbachiella ulvae]